MSKPVIFIDVTDGTHVIDKTVRISDIVNPKRPTMLDIEIETGKECDGGYIQTVRDVDRRGGLFIVNIDRRTTWLAPAHCIIYNALQKLFDGVMAIDYVTNQIGVYRFKVIVAEGQDLDSKMFQDPSTEGFESTLTGTESRDQVHFERLALKAEHFRGVLRKMSTQLDTLECVKECLPITYETDYRADLVIGYIYGDLRFYVNLVDGEIDQAAVLSGFQGDVVGIFLYDNVFVTKQQAMKQKDIELSMLSPVDFSEMMENYFDIAEATGRILSQRRAARDRGRGGRGR